MTTQKKWLPHNAHKMTVLHIQNGGAPHRITHDPFCYITYTKEQMYALDNCFVAHNIAAMAFVSSYFFLVQNYRVGRDKLKIMELNGNIGPWTRQNGVH